MCYHPQITARERVNDHIKNCRNGIQIKKYIPIKKLKKESPIEKRLLQAMKKKNLSPLRQYKILNFKVDFAFLNEKLVVECDGKDFHGDSGTLFMRQDYEARRNYLIKKEGWKIIRLTGFEIHHRADECVNYISRSLGLEKKAGLDMNVQSVLSLAGSGPICSEKAQTERTTRKRTIARRKYSFIPRPFNGGRRSHLSEDEKELLKDIRGIP